MSYLQAFITDILRKYPPIPLDTKMALGDDILPNGFKIKKGDRIMYSPLNIGNCKYIFDNPSEIIPERWINTQLSMYKQPIFNGGYRMCLGKDMAYIQIGITICTILNKFDIKLITTEIKLSSSITLNIKDKLEVELIKRN